MNILVITGDTRFAPSNPRFDLQASRAETLASVYWGPQSLHPRIPEGHFDVVTVQDPFLRGFFAWRVARRLRARFNVQVHTDLSAQSFFRHILAQIILRHADSIRVVSEKIKKQVEKIGVHAPIHVLPVFVDIEKFRNLPHVPHPRFAKTLLWMGRFEPEKDPLCAIEILKEIRNQGIDVGLIMLGAGSMKETLEKAARGLLIEFPGWQDPLPYLSMADAVLSTSKHESWGASIVEALAAGVPVISPDVGVAKEAGAFIAKRSELSVRAAEVLRTGMRGALQLPLLSQDEWADAWVKTL